MELWRRLLTQWQDMLDRIYLEYRPKVNMDDIETRMYLLERRVAAHTPHVLRENER